MTADAGLLAPWECDSALCWGQGAASHLPLRHRWKQERNCVLATLEEPGFEDVGPGLETTEVRKALLFINEFIFNSKAALG